MQQADVHEQLVEGPVEEGGVQRDDRMQPPEGQTGRGGDRVLFRDADVEEPVGETLSEPGEPGRVGHRRSDRDNVLPLLRQPHELPGEDIGPVAGLLLPALPGDRVGDADAVHPVGVIGQRRGVAVPLLRHSVDDDGSTVVPRPAQGVLQRVKVVAVNRAEIGQSQVTEQGPGTDLTGGLVA